MPDSAAAKQIILHVGLHKTGTTFLQERVFPALPDVRFVHPLHRPRPNDGPIERFVFELLFRNAVCLDFEAHRAAIGAWIEAQPESTILISSEALVGWPFENHCNLSHNAEWLARLFPSAKIWLVVRRQDKWVGSAYAQLIKAGLSTTIERYLNADPSAPGGFGRYNDSIYNGPNLDARDLDWDAFDRHYRSRWGEQAVLTLPFELFTADNEEFLRRFYAFAGIEQGVFPDASERVNERWSPLTTAVAKAVNKVPMPVKKAVRERLGSEWHPARVLEKNLGPLLPGGRVQHLSPELGEALMQLHAEGNAALGERIGVDLTSYGYC